MEWIKKFNQVDREFIDYATEIVIENCLKYEDEYMDLFNRIDITMARMDEVEKAIEINEKYMKEYDSITDEIKGINDTFSDLLTRNCEDIRQNGSHVAFRHKTSNNVVPIPQHTRDFNKGLMYGLQKQLYNNSKNTKLTIINEEMFR